MKKLILLLVFFPTLLSAQYFEPVRGNYVPPAKERYKYDANRTLATGLFGFMGGVVRDDSQRGRFFKQGIFLGTAISIGLPGNGKKRPMKYLWRDLGAGILGAAAGTILKNNVRGWQ